MNNSVKMKSIYAFADALHERDPLLVFEFAFDFENVKELSSGTVLENEVDISFVCEESVHANQVDVVEESLNLDLSSQLVPTILFADGFFFDDFECDCYASLVMSESGGGYLAR